MNIPFTNPELTTTDVFDILHACGKPLYHWGNAIDNSPILSVQTGGDRQPAIFICAGAHSHEPAGVQAPQRPAHVFAFLDLLDQRLLLRLAFGLRLRLFSPGREARRQQHGCAQ